MFLERACIKNYRGIRKLKIDFEESSTVLIGENSWGKTSLLRALWEILGGGEKLCRFNPEDLYVPIPLFGELTAKQEDAAPRPLIDFKQGVISKQNVLETEEDVFCDTADCLTMDLYFRQSTVVKRTDIDRDFSCFYIRGSDGFLRVHWRIEAKFGIHGFETRHNLINGKDQAFKFDNQVKNAIFALIRFNPVLRFRDHRMAVSLGYKNLENQDPNLDMLSELMQRMNKDPDMTGHDVMQTIGVMRQLLNKYVASYAQKDDLNVRSRNKKEIEDIVYRPISLESMSTIENMLSAPGINKSKVLASLFTSALLISKGRRIFDKSARPILILEDIEARFHPSLLLSFWSLIENLDLQKIVTTNSGDLLSAMNLMSLRRLHRKFYDTASYKIHGSSFSEEDLRKIAFHVRLNRPMVLFARCWLLVEGETEVWILSQAAAVMGISLQCSGVRIIEFAQCGLKPLIKMAGHLGIDFHVMTDGDEAGQKYAKSVAGMNEAYADRLTVLPHLDIEHYFYHNGYADVFKEGAGIKGHLRKGDTADKVIETAIKRCGKPGLALMLVSAIQLQGAGSLPKLIVEMIENLRQQCMSYYF